MKQKIKKMRYDWELGFKKQEIILWSVFVVEVVIVTMLWIYVFVLGGKL